MSEEKINQLNILENSLAQIISQKQQFQKILLETESALTEIKDKDEAYQIVGSIMIKKDTKEIQKELDERKELYSKRVQALEKQEKNLQEQTKNLREELLKNLEK